MGWRRGDEEKGLGLGSYLLANAAFAFTFLSCGPAALQGARDLSTGFVRAFFFSDETFSRTVHTRTSYRPDELVWNARFAGIFDSPKEGEHLAIDLRRLSEIESLS